MANVPLVAVLPTDDGASIGWKFVTPVMIAACADLPAAESAKSVNKAAAKAIIRLASGTCLEFMSNLKSVQANVFCQRQSMATDPIAQGRQLIRSADRTGHVANKRNRREIRREKAL